MNKFSQYYTNSTILIILLISQVCQSKSIDSYNIAISKCNENLYKDLTESSRYAKVALEKAKSTIQRAETIRLIGIIQLYSGETKNARDTLYKAINTLNATENVSYLKGNIYNVIGETYNFEQNFVEAKNIYIKALRTISTDTTLKCKQLKAKLYNNLSEIALFQNDLDSAKYYLESALNYVNEKSDSTEDKRILGYIYENKARLFEKKEDLKSAFENLNKSFSIRKNQKYTNRYEYILGAYTMGVFKKLYENEIIENDSNDLDYFTEAFKELSMYNNLNVTNTLTKHLTSALNNEKKLRDKQKGSYLLTQIAVIVLVIVIIVLIILALNYLQSNKKLKSLNKDLNQLNEIGQEISRTISPTNTDISLFIENIYKQINSLINAPIVTIAIHNKKTNLLDYYGMENGEYLKYSSRSLEKKDNPIVLCFIEQKQMIINNYDQSNFHKALEDEGGTPKTVATFPITIKKELIGVFSLQSFENLAYEGKDIILNILENKISIAINNFISYEKINTFNNEVTHLLSIIKHDVSMPINFGLLAVDELIKRKLTTEIKSLNALKSIQNAFLDLKEKFGLISTINLEISKAKAPINLEIINPYQFFNDILVRYETYYKNEGIDIKLDYHNIGTFESDKNIIRFIISNLISNSFKSIKLKESYLVPFKGKIDINIYLEDDILKVTVSDNGIGIEENKKFSSGSGIALKLCHKMVSDYRREFIKERPANQVTNNFYHSNNENKEGCTFFLNLPVNKFKKC